MRTLQLAGPGAAGELLLGECLSHPCQGRLCSGSGVCRGCALPSPGRMGSSRRPRPRQCPTASTALPAASAGVWAHLSQPHITVVPQGRWQRVLKQPQSLAAGSDKQGMNAGDPAPRCRLGTDALFCGQSVPSHSPWPPAHPSSRQRHRVATAALATGAIPWKPPSATGPGWAERAVPAEPGSSRREQRAAIHPPKFSSRTGG